MIKITYILVLTFIISTNIVFSQSVNEQKFRLAESFESNGDLEGALRLYSELINEVPDSDIYFEGYVRIMKSMDKYSDLLNIVKERLPKKESLEMLDLFAELNWRTGNTEAANLSWSKALEKFSSAQRTYLIISQTQINLRLFEKAINTLLSGRNVFGDPRLFSDPLIKLYIAIGDYKNGTKEIINYLNIDFNLPQAQGRLYALMINEEAKIYIGDELKKISEKQNDNIVFQEVYAWYLKSSGRAQEALKLVEKIDEMKNTKGLELLNFASSLSRDGDYETALKAYQLIIDKGKKNPYSSSALFGFTRAMEQKMITSKNKLDENSIDEIIKSYYRIINDFPKTSNSADSRLRLAMIYSDLLKDNKKAVAELEQLNKEFANSQYGVSAYIELGNIFIKEGELDKADICFNKVKDLSRFATPEQKDKALYHSALTTYFRGDIENVKKMFAVLALNPNTDIANDVLKKMYLINSNEEKVAALEIFAKAEFNEFRENYEIALELFKEVSELADKSSLGETALMNSAEIEFKLNNFISCRKFLNQLNNNYPDSKNIDYRISLIAESFYAENNMAEALKYYTELITKYPESIYLQEARKKIRIIRKDNI